MVVWGCLTSSTIREKARARLFIFPAVGAAGLADAELPSDRLSVADSISLVQALRAVPDPRQRRGRRHGLQSILLLALGAVLAGAHSYAAIADWAAQADHAVTDAGRRRTPPRSAACWPRSTSARWSGR